MNVKTRLTKLEKSWILYDVGNSALTLLVSTLSPFISMPWPEMPVSTRICT